MLRSPPPGPLTLGNPGGDTLPRRKKNESLLRGGGSFLTHRGKDATRSAGEAPARRSEGEARRGCPAAPGWRLPPRPKHAHQRPGRALGSAPPPPSLRPSLPLLRRPRRRPRRRRRRGGRGRGGGWYCGERQAGRGGGGLQQLTQEGAGASRSRGARPARRGWARWAPALVHCERPATGRRAGRASTTAVPPPPPRPPDAPAPVPSGLREQSRPLYPELLGHRGGPYCGRPRRARGQGEAAAGGGPRAQATPQTNAPGGGGGSHSTAGRGGPDRAAGAGARAGLGPGLGAPPRGGRGPPGTSQRRASAVFPPRAPPEGRARSQGSPGKSPSPPPPAPRLSLRA